jgi:tetratricopeptide (TPR) repeat protein
MLTLIELIDEDPTLAAPYNNLGFISWQQERWADAFGLFREAVRLDNTNEDYLNNLLDAALKLKKIEEVAPIFEKAANDNHDNENITIIHTAITSPDNDIYQSVRAYLLGYWHPLIEEGERAIKNGEFVDAITAFVNHIDEVRPCAEAYNGLGIIQFNAKEYEEAFGLFFESLKYNPLNQDVYLNMFDCALECEREDAALQIYEFWAKEYPMLEQIRGETEILIKK